MSIDIQARNLSMTHKLRRCITGCPSGWVTRKETSLTIAEVHGIADKRRAQGKINVFATVELEAVKKHMKRSRNFFDQNNLAWGENWRLIPNTKLDEQWAWEDAVKSENMGLYRIAIASVQEQKERDRIELSEGGQASLYNPDLYPGEDAMLDRYTFTFEPGVVPDPTRDIRSGSSPQQIDRLKRELAEAHNRNAADAHNTMLKRIMEEASHVQDRCDGYTGGRKGSFNDTLIPRFTKLAELVKANNIYEDPDLDKLCNDVLDGFAKIETKDLREDESLRQEASAKAGDIMSKLNKLKSSKY
jgi:hypothetical protein